MQKQKDDLEKALKKIQKAMPTNAVKELQYEYASDSTGDPALWLWVVLKATPDTPSQETLTSLRKKNRRDMAALLLRRMALHPLQNRSRDERTSAPQTPRRIVKERHAPPS